MRLRYYVQLHTNAKNKVVHYTLSTVSGHVNSCIARDNMAMGIRTKEDIRR